MRRSRGRRSRRSSARPAKSCLRSAGIANAWVQVFGNLIGNAIKFTPERGTITVSVKRGARDVELEVSDTGPGIPEADLKRIFTPYWQAKKTAHLGAGLGLAIVRGIVEAHGGKVWAENAPGGGAVFRFTIPAIGSVQQERRN